MKVFFLQDMLFEYFGPMYLSAVLKKNGHETEIVIPKDKDYIKELKGAGLVALSCMSSGHQWYLDRAKEIKEQLGIPILFGGPHPTYFPEIIKESQVDYVCVGEGEYAILDLVNALEQGKDTEHIPNIWTKNNKNDVRPPLDLDTLPFPDRELFYKYKFLRNMPTKKFITGRGCPFQCTFCYNHKVQELYSGKGRFVRRTSPQRAIEEIKLVKEKYPLKTVRFSDDTFAMDKKWFNDFMTIYKKEIHLPFTFLLRADELDEDSIRLAKEANCHSVYFGIESGSERIRNEVLKKNIMNKDIYRTAKLLKKYKIKFGTYNMVGNPTETLEEAFSTIQMNIDIKADVPFCSIIQPYPRTKLYDICIEKGLIKKDFNADDLTTMYEETPMHIENKKEIENLHKLFYISIKFPFIFPLVKKAIKLPHNPLFNFIFLLSYAHRSFKSFNAGLLDSIKLGFQLKKTVFKS